MSTMRGEKTFTVRGIMKPGGLASAFGGNLAVMNIYAVQKILGRGLSFRRSDRRSRLSGGRWWRCWSMSGFGVWRSELWGDDAK
jgi:hypothetical protein